MTEAVDTAVYFISEILSIIPTSPFMILIGLALVLTILASIYDFVIG